MIFLLITVDYEVFIDGTGDVRHCVIDPTNLLMNTCEKYGAKLTIFFDIGEYWAFKKANEEGKLELLGYNYDPATEIESQLKDAINKGHDVQLHIHPQWLNSKIEEGKWVLDLTQSRISSLDENALKELFLKGKKTLETILKPINPSYKCVAFRAGQLFIQPEQKVLKSMKEIGFLLDSTVAPGIHSDPPQYYDFRACPSKPLWKISKSVTKEDLLGSIWEIPIMTKFMYPWQRDLKNKGKKILRNLFNPPKSMNNKSAIKNKKGRWQRLKPKHYLLNISDSAHTMESFLKSAFKKSNIDEIYPVVMLGHPYYFSDSSDLELFLKRCSERAKNKKLVFCSFSSFLETLQNS